VTTEVRLGIPNFLLPSTPKAFSESSSTPPFHLPPAFLPVSSTLACPLPTH
jgi:hypothetical protein